MKRGCPGRPRKYVLRDIIQWARENCWSEDAVIAEGATGEPGDLKTEYLRAKTEKLKRECQLADFKIETAHERLVDVEVISQKLTEQANVFRSGLERLERKCGSEALDIVLELLDEVAQVGRDLTA